jgi:hypothetical protein
MTSPNAVAAVHPSPGDDEVEFHAWEIILLLAAASVLLAWYNTSQVMTRDVYHRILGSQLDASRIDAQFALAQKWAVWGYAAVPLILWVRIAVVAMVTQLVLLLAVGDVAIGRIFRLAALAQIPLFAGGVIRIFWLSRLAPEEITQDAIALSPLSLASAFYSGGAYADPLYQLAVTLNLFELGWVIVMGIGIARLMRITVFRGFAVSGGVWLAFTILQWSMTLYLSRPA